MEMQPKHWVLAEQRSLPDSSHQVPSCRIPMPSWQGPAPRQEIKPAVREKAHAQGMSGKPALMTNAAFLR